MKTLLQDIRYGVRMLLKKPGFTLIAIVTLALGIGANTVIFSIINALVINPPLIEESENVVAVWKTPKDRRLEGFTSYLDLQDWRTQNNSFDDIAGYKTNGYTIMNADTAERVQGMRVTANFFPLLKVKSFRGRNFQFEEEKKGSERVAIISCEFWQQRLGGNESALNQQITLNSMPHTIVGILPPKFQFPFVDNNSQIWTTVAGEGTNLDERGSDVILAIGRLKQGVTLEQGQTELATIAERLAQQYPQTNLNTTIYLVNASEQIVGRVVRRALWLLLGAVAFILLIACTNIANLLLARASARQKEIAIRSALGAGRWRIARQLLTESVLLSFIAGGVGLLFAAWGISAIKFYADNQLPRLDEVQIDSRVMIFTLAISILTGLIFSLVPILKSSSPDVNEVLKSGTKGAIGGGSLRLWRDSLVVVEVALSLILLVGAGLMIKSFMQLINVTPGFEPENVLTARISMARATYQEHEQRELYINQTLERLKALPGVESVAFIAPMPFSGGNVSGDFRIVGNPIPEEGNAPSASVRSVTNEYFQTIKIPLRKGRYFNAQDKRSNVGATIINDSLARRYFPNEDPIGRRISDVGANQNDGDPQQYEIVGIVGDVHHNSLISGATPELYFPYQQNSWTWGNFLMRATVDPATLTKSMREQIQAGDKGTPVTGVQPLTQVISETVAQPRFYTLLFSLFGIAGLVLTLTGVYGVISYTVTQRTQEIGIRMALGANRNNVIRMILKQAITLTILGVIIGMAVSFALTRFIAALLFGVEPTDLFTFVVAVLVLLFAALLASYLPARRATKIDPMNALRYE